MEDRALAIPARFDNGPFAIFVLNEAVAKWHRREIMNYLKRTLLIILKERIPKRKETRY